MSVRMATQQGGFVPDTVMVVMVGVMPASLPTQREESVSLQAHLHTHPALPPTPLPRSKIAAVQ